MAFTELERKRIDRLIGSYCRAKTRSELAFVYELEGQSVILSEERPDWRDRSKRMCKGSTSVVLKECSVFDRHGVFSFNPASTGGA